MSYLSKWYDENEIFRVTQNVFFAYCYKNVDPATLLDEPAGQGGFGANIEHKLIVDHRVDPIIARMALTTGLEA